MRGANRPASLFQDNSEIRYSWVMRISRWRCSNDNLGSLKELFVDGNLSLTPHIRQPWFEDGSLFSFQQACSEFVFFFSEEFRSRRSFLLEPENIKPAIAGNYFFRIRRLCRQFKTKGCYLRWQLGACSIIPGYITGDFNCFIMLFRLRGKFNGVLFLEGWKHWFSCLLCHGFWFFGDVVLPDLFFNALKQGNLRIFFVCSKDYCISFRGFY